MSLSLHPDGHVTTREQQGGGRGWTRTRGRRRGWRAEEAQGGDWERDMQDAVVRDMVVQDTWWPSLAEGGAGPPRGLRAARPATGSSLDHSFVHTQSLSLVLALPPPSTSPGTTPRPAPHLSDGCHAHGLIVVQGGIGCAHVVAEACNCHLVTAV